LARLAGDENNMPVPIDVGLAVQIVGKPDLLAASPAIAPGFHLNSHLLSEALARNRVRNPARPTLRRRDYKELVFVHADGMGEDGCSTISSSRNYGNSLSAILYWLFELPSLRKTSDVSLTLHWHH